MRSFFCTPKLGGHDDPKQGKTEESWWWDREESKTWTWTGRDDTRDGTNEMQLLSCFSLLFYTVLPWYSHIAMSIFILGKHTTKSA